MASNLSQGSILKSALVALLLLGASISVRAQDYVPPPSADNSSMPAEQGFDLPGELGGGAGAVGEGGEKAQTDIDRILQDEQLRIGLQEAFQRKVKLRQPDVDIRQMGTLFFTVWQHALLQEAKERFRTRPVAPGEVSANSGANEGSAIRGPREIRLGGIAFRNTDEWTIWLNGVRVTPDAIPKEVIDIKVAGDFIELKWFDSFSNLIFPVRLRPHERFNMDSRIFLPGEGAPQ